MTNQPNFAQNTLTLSNELLNQFYVWIMTVNVYFETPPGMRQNYFICCYWRRIGTTRKQQIAIVQFYVQYHSNRIPIARHLERVKYLMYDFTTCLVVGIQVMVFSHFRAWSITWPCCSKEKMLSLLRLTHLSMLSPVITMQSMIGPNSPE